MGIGRSKFKPKTSTSPALAQAYDAELLGALERGLLQRLCQQVEGDLRLHLHAAQEPGLSLNSSAGALQSAAPLVRLPPLRVHTRVLYIR